MGLKGSTHGLLDGRHAHACEGTEYVACRPVVVPAGYDQEPTYLGQDGGAEIVVVLMVWCGECNAADWEVVPR